MPKQTPTNAAWMKANTTSVFLKLTNNTDKDILHKLESVPNKQGYIKRLIREDLARNNETEFDRNDFEDISARFRDELDDYKKWGDLPESTTPEEMEACAEAIWALLEQNKKAIYALPSQDVDPDAPMFSFTLRHELGGANIKIAVDVANQASSSDGESHYFTLFTGIGAKNIV